MQFAPPKQYLAKFEDKIQHNEKFVQYMFELVEPHDMPFVAGQYVSIKVNDAGERRSYSICSSPDITHGFELALDITPGGAGCKYLEGLQFGQEISLLGPMGRFVVEDEALAKEPALIFIATGSGIAPFHSMLLDMLQLRHDKRPMVLYWGLRHEQELFWELEFKDLSEHFPNFSFHPVISRPGAEWNLCTGHVSDCLTKHGIAQPAGFYLCGNKPMIEETTALLLQTGVTPEYIHHEKFYQPFMTMTNPTTDVNKSKQIGKYRVEVIREKCIAAASCTFIAPKVFELDEENLVRILSQDGDDDESKLLAAQSCPTAAIIVIDTETGKQVWPVA